MVINIDRIIHTIVNAPMVAGKRRKPSGYPNINPILNNAISKTENIIKKTKALWRMTIPARLPEYLPKKLPVTNVNKVNCAPNSAAKKGNIDFIASIVNLKLSELGSNHLDE